MLFVPRKKGGLKEGILLEKRDIKNFFRLLRNHWCELFLIEDEFQ